MPFAQNFNAMSLDFHGANSFIEKNRLEASQSGGMSAELYALRERLLTIPPQVQEELLPSRFYDYALTVANRYDIPSQIFFNLITTESNWNPVVTSSRGAIGLTQLMPQTAVELGVNPWNAQQNIEGGARYLRQQKDQFGTWSLALAAYNAGPGAVSKYGGIPPYKETEAYVQKILGH
ncbi:hypothetical protein A9Q96_12105 [Rhodobacterales bacterium 52_120_T64]|nr:hypothetical protein A9Q96_12105 [Rhodobacterales bacterium 52_120_T64]